MNFKKNYPPSGLHEFQNKFKNKFKNKFPKELYPNVVRGILLQIGWSMTMGAPHWVP